MTEIHIWRKSKDLWIVELNKRTGQGLNAWNRQISQQSITDEHLLQNWLLGVAEVSSY